jgi:hypothetical protein
VYSLIGMRSDSDVVSRALRIAQNHGGELTANDLRRYDRSLSDSDEAERTLSRLVELGWGFWKAAEPTVRGGRPTRRFVLNVYETQ